MRFTDVRLVDWVDQQTQHRGGGYVMKTLLQGDESKLENYWFFIAKGDASYTSPRHRHNFDQLRFVLEGHANMMPRHNIRRGEIGYFPEGVAYGPQVEDVPNTMMMIQFGSSDSGYLSPTTLKQAYSALSKDGRFEGGVFRRPDEDGRKNQDAFEALWEHVNERPVAYAEPRYAAPVVIRPGSFAWREAGAGVARKPLGTFSEREVSIEIVRIAADASWRCTPESGFSLIFVCAGTGRIDEHDYTDWCAAEVEQTECATVAATELTELLIINLPPIVTVPSVRCDPLLRGEARLSAASIEPDYAAGAAHG